MGQAAEVVEYVLVGACPGPSGGEAEPEAALVVDDASGDAVEPGKDGGAYGELPGLDAAELFGPSADVVWASTSQASQTALALKSPEGR